MDRCYLSRIGVPLSLEPVIQLIAPEDVIGGAHSSTTAKSASPDKPAAAPPSVPKAKSTAASATGSKNAGAAAPSGSVKNFLAEVIEKDLTKGGRCHYRAGRKGDQIITRFPPEPNGYLHLGHCKSICINFGLAKTYGGQCNLRFDDTNPAAEETEYVDSIQEDVKWLGFDWNDNLFYTSGYFDQLYEWAEYLIKAGNAYVDSQTREKMKENRGSITKPGTDSPFRTRSVDENLKLFREMKAGKFKDGEHVLRAKIDMASSNMNLRDPPIYRILHKTHHRTGDKWCIYPIYDFAHGQSDAIEGITHSICTLEFEAHNALYRWFVENLPIEHPPVQTEFARLNVTHTVMSKRKLLSLVRGKVVDGWDDPRMPTICGMRRRGVTPEALRNFVAKVGVTTSYSITDVGLLEDTIRDDLEPRAHRRMVVLDPIKVVVEDYPDKKVEEVKAQNHPSRPEDGSRTLKFAKNIYINRDDFKENPPAGYFRLQPGGEVKLRHCYVIKCKEVVKDKSGAVVEVRCTHDPTTRDGMPEDRKVKGVIHWVSADHCYTPGCVNLYDYLLKEDGAAEVEAEQQAEEDGEVDDAVPAKDDFMKSLNPDSRIQLKDVRMEESLSKAKPMDRFQFERTGFFVVDKYSPPNGPLVFNRTIGLKESAHKPDAEISSTATARKAAQAKQAAEKESKKSVKPQDMFRSQTDLYSKFDDDGVPTHGADGEALPKSRVKKVRTEWEKQKKLFEKS